MFIDPSTPRLEGGPAHHWGWGGRAARLDGAAAALLIDARLQLPLQPRHRSRCHRRRTLLRRAVCVAVPVLAPVITREAPLNREVSYIDGCNARVMALCSGGPHCAGAQPILTPVCIRGMLDEQVLIKFNGIACLLAWSTGGHFCVYLQSWMEKGKLVLSLLSHAKLLA